MRTIICLMCLVCLCAFTSSKMNVEETGIPITINMTDIRPDVNGNIVVSVYVKEDVFPDKPYKFYEVDKSNIVDGKMVYTFEVEQEGRYAICLLDDLNKNLNMDTNFFGLPKEGYGFSRDARPRGLFPPRFEDAAFDVEGEETIVMDIKMYYFL